MAVVSRTRTRPVAPADPVESAMALEALDPSDERMRVAKTKQSLGHSIGLVPIGGIEPAVGTDLPLAVEDYALIGDCTTAALVGRNGSIDWLCWPRFDSSACFAALLGTSEHGRWRICPVDPDARVSRAYRDDTMVLETVFETADGSVAVIDFMPMGQANSSVIRLVQGRRGNVAMRLHLTLRFDYGATVPWVTQLEDKSGLTATAGPSRVVTPLARREPCNRRRVQHRTRGMRALRADPRPIPSASTLGAGLARCLAADRSVLAWLVCPVHVYGSLARGGAAFPVDLEGDDLCPYRRDRRCSYHVAS
jgi:hypothetical protein